MCTSRRVGELLLAGERAQTGWRIAEIPRHLLRRWERVHIPDQEGNKRERDKMQPAVVKSLRLFSIWLPAHPLRKAVAAHCGAVSEVPRTQMTWQRCAFPARCRKSKLLIKKSQQQVSGCGISPLLSRKNKHLRDESNQNH